MHTPENPQEYFRVAMAHPAAEKDVLFADRVIGFISITRSKRTLPTPAELTIRAVVRSSQPSATLR